MTFYCQQVNSNNLVGRLNAWLRGGSLAESVSEKKRIMILNVAFLKKFVASKRDFSYVKALLCMQKKFSNEISLFSFKLSFFFQFGW